MTKKVKKADSAQNEVNELKKKILNLRLQMGVSGLSKPHELKNLKKEIARKLTAKL